MRLVPALTVTALLTLPAFASAQTPANCALANAVDSGIYAALTIDIWSEADEDNAAGNWADCRATALRRSLSGNPKLSARIDGLRKQLQQLRALEGQFAYIRAGGGTLYSHAIPRSFPYLEEQLAGLAALARTTRDDLRAAQAWIAGESASVAVLGRYLLARCGVRPEAITARAHWRREPSLLD